MGRRKSEGKKRRGGLRESLTAKIFALTAGLLFLVSMITYGCVTAFLPAVYENALEEDLQRVSEELKKELANYDTVEDAANLLELFAANNQASVTLLDLTGAIVFPAYEQGDAVGLSQETSDTVVCEQAGEAVASEDGSTAKQAGEDVVSEDGSTAKQAGEAVAAGDVAIEYGEGDLILQVTQELFPVGHSTMKSYEVKIGKEDYRMLVAGTMQSVSQAMKILKEILPLILLIIAGVSLMCAGAAAVFLTRPIVRLSRVSQKMAGLQFDEECPEKRRDEVGVLGRNLNELSRNLGDALENLEQANAKLKKDMEKERSFFAAASHELKTPVTILKGHLGGMCQNMGPYQNRDYYLKRSYEVTETMEGMIQEILAVSKMESGVWEAKREPVDLAELIRLQAAELLELMEEKDQELFMEIPEHQRCMADKEMMVKVFRNLLVNAIRYSPEGARIHICLQKREESLLFWIENTGVHLPEDSIGRIFDAFYRVEDSRNRKSGGSGLGLYIVRMILKQHGAACGAENSRDGVRIWFRMEENLQRSI